MGTIHLPQDFKEFFQRIEILTSISGVEFYVAYEQRIEDVLDGVPVKLISLRHLKANKVAAARTKDLADLEELP